MRIIDLGRQSGSPVMGFGSSGASWVGLSRSSDVGSLDLGVVHLAAGGQIGRREAVRPQLLLVVAGEGWVAGEDGSRLRVRTGEAAYVGAGEIHEAGTDAGLTAVVVEAERLPLLVDEPRVLVLPELAGTDVGHLG